MKSATRCSAARSDAYVPSMRTKHPGMLTGSTLVVLDILGSAVLRGARPRLEVRGTAALAHEVALRGFGTVGGRPLFGRLQIAPHLLFEQAVVRYEERRRRRRCGLRARDECGLAPAPHLDHER